MGVRTADALHIGPADADAEHCINNDNATGNLYYDANGTGAGELTQFAKLGIGLALTNADFAVV